MKKREEEWNEMPIIEDVNLDTIKYIKKYYFWRALFFILICIIIEGWLIYKLFISVDMEPGIIALPLFILLFGYSYVSLKVSNAFITQFADRNGYSYIKEIDNIENLESLYLSKLGRMQTLRDIVVGTFNNHPIRLYSFVTYAGFRKGSSVYSVFEMQFTGDILSIILDSNIHPFDILITGERFENKKKLTLEGDFNEYFDVYVTEDYEIEVLSILTPDIMEKLMDKAHLHSFEFNKNKLFIISDKNITNKVELEEMFEFSKWLSEKLAPVLMRIRNDHIKIESK